MKPLQLFSGIVLSTLFLLQGCKPKDADIQKAVQEKLNAKPDLSVISATVSDRTVTLTGEVKTDNAKTEGEKTAADTKGVKSVINNVRVAVPLVTAPAPPPVIAQDDALTSAVNDAVKDFPGVSATVSDGVVTLTGNVSKDVQRKIMMSVNALHPKKVENKLTVK